MDPFHRVGPVTPTHVPMSMYMLSTSSEWTIRPLDRRSGRVRGVGSCVTHHQMNTRPRVCTYLCVCWKGSCACRNSRKDSYGGEHKSIDSPRFFYLVQRGTSALLKYHLHENSPVVLFCFQNKPNSSDPIG